MRIIDADIAYEIKELKAPFGFKGSDLTGLWQTVVSLRSETHSALGLGVQSVLWSDSGIFAELGEKNGNRLMYEVTRFALYQLYNESFENPFTLLDFLIPKAMDFARQLAGRENIKLTFILNALVPIDLAAWILFAKENHLENFQAMTGIHCGKYQNKLANIPLITYHTGLEEIDRLARAGYSLFKIKIGADPERDGDLDKMLEWDQNRLSEIHQILSCYETPYSACGKPVYYLDANGRYDTKDRLKMFLDYADKIGALERILILEEPFAEENQLDVSDLPVCIAADESAHSCKEAISRIELGYRAIALKPIAKTLSMTLKILEYAQQRGISCFCADLTVNPVMAEWNKNLAACLEPIPGMKIGMMESNGSQNYKDWDQMLTYHPLYGHSFVSSQNGIYLLDDEFYQTSGGIFMTSNHYTQMIFG